MKKRHEPFSRRERQIMDVVYRLGQATVSDVSQAIADPPSTNAIRTMMGILVKKGHLKVKKRKGAGGSNIYASTRSKQSIVHSSLRQMINVLFGGSVEQAVAGMIEMNQDEFSPEELERIRNLVDQAHAQQTANGKGGKDRAS